MESFPSLPADIRKNYLLRHLPVEDLLRLCKTSTEYRKLCGEPKTWTDLIERDFGWSPERSLGTFVSWGKPRKFESNPKVLYRLLSDGLNLNVGKAEYRRLLNETPNVGPITLKFPLSEISSWNEYKHVIKYTFVSTLVPEARLYLKFYQKTWELRFIYEYQLFYFKIQGPWSNAVPIAVDLLNLLRYVNFVSNVEEQLTPILDSFAKQFNLMNIKEGVWADGRSRADINSTITLKVR